MNLYLLLAFAFGAMTGVADVAAPRTAAVAAIRVRAERRVSIAVRRSPYAIVLRYGAWRTANGEPARTLAPLSGSASPRAPAATC